jgi:hypothetical protein
MLQAASAAFTACTCASSFLFRLPPERWLAGLHALLSVQEGHLDTDLRAPNGETPTETRGVRNSICTNIHIPHRHHHHQYTHARIPHHLELFPRNPPPFPPLLLHTTTASRLEQENSDFANSLLACHYSLSILSDVQSPTGPKVYPKSSRVVLPLSAHFKVIYLGRPCRS